jgi:hypothetical protein
MFWLNYGVVNEKVRTITPNRWRSYATLEEAQAETFIEDDGYLFAVIIESDNPPYPASVRNNQLVSVWDSEYGWQDAPAEYEHLG